MKCELQKRVLPLVFVVGLLPMLHGLFWIEDIVPKNNEKNKKFVLFNRSINLSVTTSSSSEIYPGVCSISSRVEFYIKFLKCELQKRVLPLVFVVGLLPMPVSYTHLTLPTIYSV